VNGHVTETKGVTVARRRVGSRGVRRRRFIGD